MRRFHNEQRIRVVSSVFQAEFDATSIREGVTFLARLDRSLRIFGASRHGYRLGELASLGSVLEIEQSCAVELPLDYRYFMASISDGGAGPNYGIKPMSQILRCCDPGKPFDINNCCDADSCTGVVWLTDNGCATTTNLIVNSANSFGKTCDLYFEESRVTIGATFRDWYLGWLNGAIRMLMKEPITTKVKKGMKLDDVRELLGNEMLRHDPGRTLLENYFLTFPDVNGGVWFDFSDRVIATHFAPHCLTPRLDAPGD